MPSMDAIVNFGLNCRAKNVLYAADVPANTQVYRREPRVRSGGDGIAEGALPPAGKS